VRALRPLTVEELPGFLMRSTMAFRSETPPAEAVAARVPSIELDRTLGAFEDGVLVGGARGEGMTMTVPGGSVSAAGVAGVAVLPTHRRRGILTDLMRRQLADLRERGDAVAMLFTSEGGIYGRYGYGIATYEGHVRVARHRGAFREPAGAGGLREAAFADAIDDVLAIVDRALPGLPGAIRRADAWWQYVASSPPDPVPQELVLREELDGFVLYERNLELSIPTLDGGTLRVGWLFADNPRAYAALWRHCLDVDLIHEVTARARPVDEPLRHLLADPRALECRVWDGLWVRLVDVEAALAARTYAPGPPLRIAVDDPFCPWNAGMYEVGEEGCRRCGGEADLALAADALAACYLGGNRFTTLARAGRVEERRAGAAARADVLFAAPRPPWCPFHF